MINIAPYHAIIFDFDGTLVDSMGLWHQIDQDYLARHGQSCPPNLSYEVSGKSFTETAVYFKTRFNLADSIESIMAEWSDMSHNTYLEAVPFKANALDLLSQLKSNNQKVAIATSNIRSTTEAYLQRHQLLEFFDALCFTNEVGIGKPDPTVFLKAAELLETDPAHCLVFEDSLEGIQGAKAAGMDAIAVADLWQGNHLDKIKTFADGFIKNFNELTYKES